MGIKAFSRTSQPGSPSGDVGRRASILIRTNGRQSDKWPEVILPLRIYYKRPQLALKRWRVGNAIFKDDNWRDCHAAARGTLVIHSNNGS